MTRRVVRRRIRSSGDGSNVVADVNAVVVSSSGRGRRSTSASSRQQVRIRQSLRRGETSTDEPENEREPRTP